MKEIALNVNPVLGTISTNFDEIEKQLAEEMKQYDGIVFTEDCKTDAKKKVAELRKLQKEVDSSRKKVKKQWLEPYNVFEDRVKNVMDLIDKPINYINEQVGTFEKKRIEERQTAIQKSYDEEIGDMDNFLPLYKIQDDKWTNASMTLTAVKKAMVEVITSTKAGKTAIEAMRSDAVPDALRKYQATLNLAESLEYINKYEAQKAEILKREEAQRKKEEERRLQAEIERAKADERKKIADEECVRKEAEEAAKAEISKVDTVAAAPLTAPESRTAVYTVVGTDEELQELEMAMNSLGLYFEKKNV